MNRKILKITTLSALAAIGVVLMSYIKIPYPIAPFLQIEISDFVVIYAFLLFGFKEALIVALLKTGCDMLVNGFQTTGGGIPFVAHGIALFASLVYILAFWLANKIIKSKKLVYSGLKYTIVVLIVSTIMTLANYIILTPLYLGEVSFFGIGVSESTSNALAGLTGTDVYFLANVILYFPFNLLKSSIISITALAIGDTLLALFKNRFHFNNEKKITKKVSNEPALNATETIEKQEVVKVEQKIKTVIKNKKRKNSKIQKNKNKSLRNKNKKLRNKKKNKKNTSKACKKKINNKRKNRSTKR